MARILLVAALLTLLFFGLAGGINYINSHKTHTLILGAGEKGSDSYVFAEAISRIAERHDPYLNIVVAETAGSEQNNDMLASGRLDLAANLTDNRLGSNTRLVTILYPDAYQLLVCDESGISSIEDIRGKVIALPGEGSSESIAIRFLMDHFQIPPSEVRLVNMSTTSAAWALESRAVDAIFKIRAPGNDQLAEIIQSGGIRLADIPQTSAMRLEQPALQTGIIPAGSYSGRPAIPAQDLQAPTVNRILVANRDVSDEVIEKLTRIIYDYQRELANETPLVGFLAGEQALRASAIPLHPGVENYLRRNDPSFIQENAEVMAFYLTLLAGLVSLMLNLNNRRQKERIDALNREIVELYNASVDDPEPDRNFYKNSMMDIFARIIRDFETGAITSNGFEFLSFTWDELNDAIIDVIQQKNGEMGKWGESS